MKGLIPAMVLTALEARSGKSCYELFDMFAGTSIGGILACLLASNKPAIETTEFFVEDGPKIFGQTQFIGHGGIVKPRYSDKPIEECLQRRLGLTRLSDLSKALVVPAFDLASYNPFFFKAPLTKNNYALWQVARATSAAQSYFPAFCLDSMVLWDGGNVANNPAICAAAEAIRLWPGEKIRVLSLSCGQAKSRYAARDLINAGIVKVGVETVSLLFDANDALPDYILQQMLPGDYFRVEPEYTDDLTIDGAAKHDIDALQAAGRSCVLHSVPILDAFLNR